MFLIVSDVQLQLSVGEREARVRMPARPADRGDPHETFKRVPGTDIAKTF